MCQSVIVDHTMHSAVVQPNNKENIKVQHCKVFVRGYWWIPDKQGPVLREVFPCHEVITMSPFMNV